MGERPNLAKFRASWEARLKTLSQETAEAIVKEDPTVLESTFADFEDLVAVVRAELCGGILKELLCQQAAKADEAPTGNCPDCRQPLAKRPSRRREMKASEGPVVWHEPVCYCNRCRRSFSPSVRSTQD